MFIPEKCEPYDAEFTNTRKLLKAFLNGFVLNPINIAQIVISCNMFQNILLRKTPDLILYLSFPL